MSHQTIFLYVGLACVAVANACVALSIFGPQDAAFQSKCTTIMILGLGGSVGSLLYATRGDR